MNLVDFDMVYGHRRDIIGSAKALEDFDSWLPAFESVMKPGDMAVITADHGCDPTWVGTEHTREYVPVLFSGPQVKAVALGERASFADMGQTLAEYFELDALAYGESFLAQTRL